MSVQIKVIPEWNEDAQKTPMTKLEVTIELSKVQAMLEMYDVLVETILTVQSKASSDEKLITTRYPYAVLVQESRQRTLSNEPKSCMHDLGDCRDNEK